MSTSPDRESLHASMRRHPSAARLEECPACNGLGKVSPTERTRLVDLICGRVLPFQRRDRAPA